MHYTHGAMHFLRLILCFVLNNLNHRVKLIHFLKGPSVKKNDQPNFQIPHTINQSWIIWGCGALFYFYQFVLRVSPGVMTTELMQAFVVQGCSLGILTSFYYNSYSALQIPLGMIMDRFGPRRCLTISALIAVMGSFVFASAGTVSWASCGRLLMGMGSACAFLGTIKLASLWFPPRRVAFVTGLTLVLGKLGAISGGWPLAYMIERISWRSAMFIVGSVGIAIAALIWFVVKDRSNNVFSAPQNQESPQKAPHFWAGLSTVAASKDIWLTAIYASLMYVPLSGLCDLWGVPFLIDYYGIERTEATTFVSFIFIGVGVGSPLIALFSDYVKSRRLPMSISSIACLILYAIIIYIPDIPKMTMYGLMFFAGFFFTGQVLSFPSVCERMPLSISGVTIGFTNCIVMLSGVIFQPLIGKLLEISWDGTMKGGLPDYTMADWRFAWLPMLGAIVLSFLFIRLSNDSYQDSDKTT